VRYSSWTYELDEVDNRTACYTGVQLQTEPRRVASEAEETVPVIETDCDLCDVC
jgi:hypothetical protein